ncbi:MAG TPA: MFS transporter [Longilinea sp.]|nr:MFS transporter [Longilinea sp.]
MQGISLKQTFSALRHYNYRLWFFGQLFSLVGTWMQTTAQGYLVFTLTNSAAYLGLVTFASGVPAIVFSLYGGVIADRISRRTLLVITQTSMMVLAFILAGLVFTNVVQPWMILVLSFLLGVANAFDMPARQAFVVELVDDRTDLVNAIALNASMFNLAIVVGPAVSGFTYAWVGPGWCFVINAVSFIAVIIALLLMHVKPLPVPEKRPSAIAQIKESMHYVLTQKTVLLMIIGLGIVSIFGFGMLNFMPVWAVDVLNGDVTTNGFLLSARGVGSLIGALTVAAFSMRGIRGKMWSWGSFLLPAMMIVFAISPWLIPAMVLLVGIGWSLMWVTNNANSLIQTGIPDEMRGRVMSVYAVVVQGGGPLGSLVIGGITSVSNAPLSAIVCGIMLLGFALYIWFTYPQMRVLE